MIIADKNVRSYLLHGVKDFDPMAQVIMCMFTDNLASDWKN